MVYNQGNVTKKFSYLTNFTLRNSHNITTTERKDFDFNLAKKVHNNFYSYDKVICVGVKKKVIITCPKHGYFLQTPYCHIIRKQGCSKCQYEQQKQKSTFTKEEFICNANKVHNVI